jgi:hypothetical protein
MNILSTNLYIFLLAVVLAILEIQIEGAHGWAKNLPTWRPTGTWYTKLYTKIMSGREFTGYHLTMFSFVFLIFHLPYVFGLTFTIDHWLRTLSFFMIFIVLWDFLWFVLNPHYPLSGFKKEHIWWHKKWIFGAPVDYYGGVIVSLLVIIPTGDLYWWAANVGLFILETVLLCLFTVYILKVDKWKTA